MEARRCAEQASRRRGGGGASRGLWWLVCGRLHWCDVVADFDVQWRCWDVNGGCRRCR
ncbi:hypothetical protein DEO72_LG11g1546 [Vigna unguiculata]|uniref:Uncharacterized protein n=1 Tax=Vigna unguiculata TaxID=3917 RepID=A0A4D6NL63_VIGUN|nr:hypothetical protein DEO72_LG11g1546 [Vigna unguiculata]